MSESDGKVCPAGVQSRRGAGGRRGGETPEADGPCGCGRDHARCRPPKRFCPVAARRNCARCVSLRPRPVASADSIATNETAPKARKGLQADP
ncbi:MAG: hypothetical protein BJ554DRAFT_6168 [Olpidium bornovanus]|uniref:Uncharacterized protein n=1 Tax=Olpidium bornovanus TaxID=278681 RepID=A0A8H8DKF5_9FUNG|nr:MAG: hypothetical protein BJ554DRAFT_6168 [Olpidium bornovanus]